MLPAKEIHIPLQPEDCVHFGELSGHKTAQDDVFRAAGDRAYKLYGYFVSSNTTEETKAKAAKRFMAITGFHPQQVRDIIQNTNSWFTE